MKHSEISQHLRARTFRFAVEQGRFRRIGASPNLGLECYLGEAYCRQIHYDLLDLQGIGSAKRRLWKESVNVEGFRVWRWERLPSIPGVEFPCDWDDTSKAVDFLRTAQRLTPEASTRDSNDVLPDTEFWLSHLKKSIYESPVVGVDVERKCNYRKTISVFFGPGSSRIPLREDPMVLVTVLRSTLLWYPEALESLVDELYEMLNRAVFVLNTCLRESVSFKKLSRYYASLGHFAYRLIETVQLSPFDFEDIQLDTDLIEQAALGGSCAAPGGDLNSLNWPGEGEREWWLLSSVVLGRKRLEDISTEGSFVGHSSQSVYDSTGKQAIDVVYRHRRLQHYYGAIGWVKRLQGMEYGRLCAQGLSDFRKEAAA